MNWIKRLFGKKTGVPKMENKPEPPLKITVVPCPLYDGRNAKGQFIKGIPNPYINRDAAGKFKSKEPDPTEGNKDISIDIDYKKV